MEARWYDHDQRVLSIVLSHVQIYFLEMIKVPYPCPPGEDWWVCLEIRLHVNRSFWFKRQSGNGSKLRTLGSESKSGIHASLWTTFRWVFESVLRVSQEDDRNPAGLLDLSSIKSVSSSWWHPPKIIKNHKGLATNQKLVPFLRVQNHNARPWFHPPLSQDEGSWPGCFAPWRAPWANEIGTG